MKGNVRGESPRRAKSTQGSTPREKRSKLAPLFLAALLLAAAAPARAVELTEPILPLAEVKAGMKGYGLTVVSGDEIRKFEVEVLGVVPNQTPRRSIIVVRVAGLNLEEAGIVAGMSGSPVYVDGKLMGALSAGWSFAKIPIGIVTPIASMLDVLDGEPSAPASARTGGSAVATFTRDLLESLGKSDEDRLDVLRKSLLSRLPEVPAREGRSLLSMSVRGIGGAAVETFRGPLERLGLLDAATAAAGVSAEAPGEDAVSPLVPGSSMTALLIDGDFQIGATGTVTAVARDGRWLAFGHPFLGFGRLELPVSRSRVVSIVPSLYQSFKIAASGRAFAAMTSDRESGIAGRPSSPPAMVPVRMTLQSEGSPALTMNWRVANHPKLVAVLVGISADAAVSAHDSAPRDKTLSFRVAVETSAGTIAYADVATGTKARETASVTASALVGAIADNEFEDPKISGVTIDVKSVAGEQRLKILDASLGTAKAAPGDTITAAVRLEGRRDGAITRVLRIKVPKETPEGKAYVLVADGSNASVTKLGLEPAEPHSLRGLSDWIGRLVPSDTLAALLLVPSRGASTGNATLTSLPPTAASLLSGNPEPGDVREVKARLVAESTLSLGRPVAGVVKLEIEIERPRS